MKRVKTTKMNIWVLSCRFCSLYLFFIMKLINIIVNKSQHTMHCFMEEKHWLQMLIPDWIIFMKRCVPDRFCGQSINFRQRLLVFAWEVWLGEFPTSFRFSSYIQEQNFTINHKIFYFLLQSWLYLQHA